jgi:signal transduction histidine kinase
VVQESLMNSFRHGKASRVRIFLRRQDEDIVLKVSDNGMGAAIFVEGIGLAGMRERLGKLGGTLSARGVAGGFDVIASVPASQG